jgi:hypothetical protein
MRLKPILALSFFFAIAYAIPAWAQQRCMELQAFAQAILPSPYPIYTYNTWGGNVYASLDGQLLLGIFSGGGEDSLSHGVNTVGKDGFYKFVFGTDSLIIQFPHAVWPFPPGKVGIGEYRGEGMIVAGTGRFANSWGNINWSGPFIVWTEGENFYSRFNAEIKGNICGAQ